jgi:hypothetical protein
LVLAALTLVLGELLRVVLQVVELAHYALPYGRFVAAVFAAPTLCRRLGNATRVRWSDTLRRIRVGPHSPAVSGCWCRRTVAA